MSLCTVRFIAFVINLESVSKRGLIVTINMSSRTGVLTNSV